MGHKTDMRPRKAEVTVEYLAPLTNLAASLAQFLADALYYEPTPLELVDAVDEEMVLFKASMAEVVKRCKAHRARS